MPFCRPPPTYKKGKVDVELEEVEIGELQSEIGQLRLQVTERLNLVVTVATEEKHDLYFGS